MSAGSSAAGNDFADDVKQIVQHCQNNNIVTMCNEKLRYSASLAEHNELVGRIQLARGLAVMNYKKTNKHFKKNAVGLLCPSCGTS